MLAARASLCVAVLALFLTATLATTYHTVAQTHYIHPLLSVSDDSTSAWHHLQVGAWGNQDSVGNVGVQAEIQTHTYDVSNSSEDAFWIGDILSNGAFIQFGYLLLSPGYYCLVAHVAAGATTCTGADDTISLGDARWFWAYFPNARNIGEWYYEFGLKNSAGMNSTWHLYSIIPTESGNWSFQIDGMTTYTTPFQYAPSSSPAHFVAEKAAGPDQQQLGPVEFRDLAYLDTSGLWHGTSSLTPIVGCGEGDTNPCNFVPYGVAAVGANDVLAGSGVPTPPTAHAIWSRQTSCEMYMTLSDDEGAGPAPLNVSITTKSYAAHGSVRTDWWFGDGSFAPGDSSRTITYDTPGNYSILARDLDSVGCLSEARGAVLVMQPNLQNSVAPSVMGISRMSFILIVSLFTSIAPVMVLNRPRPGVAW